METTNEVQINVLTNFQLSIPVAGEPAAFVFTQIESPSFGITLTRVGSNEESFHYQIQMVKNASEEEIPDGLLWAKRTPHLFKKIENTEKIEALLCRLKIAGGVFNFRRNKYRSIRFVVRCFSNDVLLSTGISQLCRVLPKKRLADDDSTTVIQICWQPDALPASVPQIESTFSQYYSSPEDHDEDSVMGNFNNSDEYFQSSSNEIDEDLSLIPTSSASYSASELQSAFTNDQSDQYMVLYNGNAEVVGNFRALNFYKASDINIKEDVRLLIENEQRDPRSVLLKIDGVEYKFKDSVRHTTNKRFVGYIAQQIESVVPEAVQLIDGILHVDYESLIPYLSESIKQNFKDITDMKADISDFKEDSRQLHRIIDSMYKEFVKKEQDRCKKSTNGAAQSRQQSRNRSLRWIIGTSLTVFLLVSVAIGVFFVVPFIHSSQNGSNPPSPEVQHPSPSESPTARPRPFPSIDQDTLVALYHATGGDSWFIRIGSLLSISVCEWPPVTCDSDFRVIKLEFDNGLAGTLPNSIGRLDRLQTLRMSSIGLYGTIPASIGNLTNLVRLDLHGLGVTGTVPSEIFSLPLVKDLVLKNNEFLSWTIPSQIASMKRLENFDARHSGLHGTIPDEISQLTNLKRLKLEDNDLTGTVPSLANTNVTQLYLTNNQLTGPVPKMNEKLLQEADGHQEGFYVSVELANNSFSGEFDIPFALWMDQIGHFDITNNQFTSVSSRFDAMTNNSLTCKAEGNPFKCPIPESFKTLCKATCT